MFDCVKDTHIEMWRAQIEQLLSGGGNLAGAYGDRRTNEELVRALVGRIEGSNSRNLLTGLQVSWHTPQSPLTSLCSLGGEGRHHQLPGQFCQETQIQLQRHRDLR